MRGLSGGILSIHSSLVCYSLPGCLLICLSQSSEILLLEALFLDNAWRVFNSREGCSQDGQQEDDCSQAEYAQGITDTFIATNLLHTKKDFFYL